MKETLYPSVFEDPGDGRVLLAMDRPPNYFWVTPDELAQYVAQVRPYFLKRVAGFLNTITEDELRQLKAALTRDLLK